MSSNALFVHVPVDRVQIVDGPALERILFARLQRELEEARLEGFFASSDGKMRYTRLKFTLRTSASQEPFGRDIPMASIGEPEDGVVQFTALFCDKVVSGVYDTRTRTGWFSLD